MDRLDGFFEGPRVPNQGQITRAFWAACHGGQRGAAEYFFSRGADLNWIGHGDMTPLDVASRPDAAALVGQAGANELIAWLKNHGARSRTKLIE